jgi:hypothetical protein
VHISALIIYLHNPFILPKRFEKLGKFIDIETMEAGEGMEKSKHDRKERE